MLRIENKMHKLQKALETDLNGSVCVKEVKEDIMTENGN
jgi:hypothetical protein